MKRIAYLILLIPIINACSPLCKMTNNNTKTFVKVRGTQFMIGNKPYNFIGTNFWAGMNLGSVAKSGNRNRLIRELDAMQNIGINNLRIMALTEGPDTEPFRIVPSNNDKGTLNEDYLIGLDFLLSEMKKRNMYAVVCLSNFWPWSGGFAQYQKWARDIEHIEYPMDTINGNWDLYMKNTAKFYSSQRAIQIYHQSISKVISRKNTVTNILYKDDATIMSWQLCNEPRGMNNVKDYLKWIDTTASLIKSIDNNHLVSIGSEGFTSDKIHNGTPFIETHSFKKIDYTTAHLWIQNWGMYNPSKHNETYIASIQFAKEYIKEHVELSNKLNKPFVIEEFGIMKDSGSYNPTATTKNRDSYFDFVFNEIYQYSMQQKASGVNFWAWSGEGRPRANACWWSIGDDFTGDPPHELQGWYSVYDTDTSTHNVIKKYAALMKSIK
ncbi:MAG: mannanase [Bacteroidetes bacterium]|nr:mannanase [Bacteroidota bacterium]